MLIWHVTRDDLMRLCVSIMMYVAADLTIHVLFYDNHYYLCHVYLYFSK